MNAARNRGARNLAQLANPTLQRALARRAGLTIGLFEHWRDIVGPSLADTTRPERVRWGRRTHLGEVASPGTLTISCGAGTGLTVQHMTGELIERINTIFGYPAIGRIAIVNRMIEPDVSKPDAPGPSTAARQRIERAVDDVEDERLRAALRKLGEAAAIRPR